MNDRKHLAPKLAALQAQFAQRSGAGGGGKSYWRTLDELAGTEAFQELIRQEYPEEARHWPDTFSRRRFLTLMGASLALAGVSGCSLRPAPTETVVPYVRTPEEIVPGRPLFFATAMTLGGRGFGLLVESHMGRPTKIEGNPEHPASLGATDAFHQASILSFYDPDRSQTVTRLGQTRTWGDALDAMRTALESQHQRRGAGLRLLLETVVSPTLARQLRELLAIFPDAKWHQYEPLAEDAALRGAVLAFDEHVNTIYDFKRADVVLSLDADFLSSGPGSVRYLADFMSRRRVRTTAADAGSASMNRLYMVEPEVTLTGAKADHRLAVKGSAIANIARSVAAALGIQGVTAERSEHQSWIDAVARDLNRDRGASVVIAGARQPASVHLLVHAINQHLGNLGRAVLHTAPVEAQPVDQAASLGELAEDMERGRVQMLVIVGGNPAYSAPADLRFGERLQVWSSVPSHEGFHLSLYQDETARRCRWHLPEAHFLEAWSDTRAFDGTASIVQPLIEPWYQGRSAHELLSMLTQQEYMPGYETVRATWAQHWANRSAEFAALWQTAVHDGVVAGTTLPTQARMVREGWQERLGAVPPAGAANGRRLELAFQPDSTIYDGRFANNGWLQELPKPITTLTWDNAALMSPATARGLGVGFGSRAHGGEHGGYLADIVELRLGESTLRAPVWIVPGHADDCISISLGYGREFAGRVGGGPGNQVGVNAYALRTSANPWFAPGLEVHKTGASALLACTQGHHLMENRDVVRAGTLEQYRRTPNFAAERDLEHPLSARPVRRPLTMYEPFDYPERKWGMLIDLTACTGCKACVVACQAENNIPVVGKEQVLAGREMHWLRVDRYVEGPADKPGGYHFQPVPCMHCENAPCEYVCPTEATNHSADGLNDMVYQRCVGTRFCSNNCPYKVRRFNFFSYADFVTPSVRLQYNPDVTVRSRGVMEKCTYCVQRIRRAEIDAEVEERPTIDGEILTACQAACPAQAIIFGDINDRASAVRAGRGSPLNYGLLTELNTNPRTTYLAALRNPNPELEGA
jgi:molybdopterin-containing oxidoreductase family iron-sulfur binding subunit